MSFMFYNDSLMYCDIAKERVREFREGNTLDSYRVAFRGIIDQEVNSNIYVLIGFWVAFN